MAEDVEVTSKRLNGTTSTAPGWNIQEMSSLKGAVMYVPRSDYEYDCTRQIDNGWAGSMRRGPSQSLAVGCPHLPSRSFTPTSSLAENENFYVCATRGRSLAVSILISSYYDNDVHPGEELNVDINHP